MQRRDVISKIEGVIQNFVQRVEQHDEFLPLLGRSIKHDPKVYSQTLIVLSYIHTHLIANEFNSKTVTCRDIYYGLKSCFSEQRGLDRQIEFICRLLDEPRINLGVCASSRGSVIGRLRMTLETGRVLDCSHETIIAGDMSLQAARLHSDAKFVVVVEKDTIFQSLAQSCFFNQVPCILLTGRGMPDVATRALVSKLARELGIPSVVLCDWNPGGFQIVHTFRWGSSTALTGRQRFDCPTLAWAGLLSQDVESLVLPETCRLPLTHNQEKRIVAQRLLTAVAQNPSLAEQLRKMEELKVTVEMDALHWKGKSFLVQWLTKRLISKEWVELCEPPPNCTNEEE